MYNRVLVQMRERIRTHQYVMTIHAEEEMTDGDILSPLKRGASADRRCGGALYGEGLSGPS